MKKRKFLKQSAMALSGVSVAPSLLFSSCKSEPKQKPAEAATLVSNTTFSLPEIPYGYNAFPDTIDAMTMEIHHSKHHQGYTNKLNAALAEAGIAGKTIEELLSMKELPAAIRNNGGGFYNHSLYWDVLTPSETEINGTLMEMVTTSFGSLEALMNELADAGAKRFGSGWAWLCQGMDKELFVISTPNQDNPLMQTEERRGMPLLGIDVWEHAYYLKYQNKRGDYLQNILKIINWDKVASRLS